MRSSQDLVNTTEQMAVNGDAQSKNSVNNVVAKQQGLSGSCQLAVQVDEKLEQLGELYNEIEEQLFKLECADKSREQSIQKCKDRLVVLETRKAETQLVNEKPAKTNNVSRGLETSAFNLTPLEGQLAAHDLTLAAIVQQLQVPQRKEQTTNETSFVPKNVLGEPGSDAVVSIPHEEQLAKHESTLSEIIQRLEQLDSKGPTTIPTTSQSTHHLAQSLIQRLKDGDVLNPTDSAQLKAALQQQSTVIPHGASKQTSTPASTDSTGTEGKPFKRKRGRPPLERHSNDEPLVKRPRGRPSLLANEGSILPQPTKKKPQGRPPKNTSSLRKTKSESGQNPSDTPELSSSTNLPNMLMSLADADFRGSVAVPSTEADITSGTVQENNVQNETPQKNNVQKQAVQKETTSRESMQKEIVPIELAEEEPLQKGTVSKETMPKQTAQNETTQNTIAESFSESTVSKTSETAVETQEKFMSPPERRSGREPKPTKPFGDVMSWKEANLHMQHLKPHLLPKSTS